VSGGATVEEHERLRVFLALELPADVVDELVRWGKRHLARGRPVGSFHVTLAFLGSRPRSELEVILGALREAAAAATPFTLEPVRYRETRSVGMLVLGDPGGGATELAERLQARFEEFGVYRREARPWLPHVTVLRFRERPRLSPPLPRVGTFAPSGVAAFLSRLHPSGARYEVLESCSLGEKSGG
jgi:2'-5' RNA ligase